MRCAFPWTASMNPAPPNHISPFSYVTSHFLLATWKVSLPCIIKAEEFIYIIYLVFIFNLINSYLSMKRSSRKMPEDIQDERYTTHL